MRRRFGAKQGTMLKLADMSETYIVNDGSVRSGKSLAIAYGFTRFTITNFDDPTNFLLAAPTITQVRDPMLAGIYQACDDWRIPYEPYRSDRKYAMVGPHKLYGFSADSTNDHRRVRGLTFGGAWIDEAADVKEEFIDMVDGRCSLPNPKIVTSTNPKGPFHWYKRRFIDHPSEDVLRTAWQLSDNPYGIDTEYIDRLKRNLQGAALRRDVYGEWVAESGLVYPYFKPSEPPDGEPLVHDLALDFASSSVTHAVLAGIYNNSQMHVIDEWRWDGRERVELTPDEQAARIRDWLGVINPRRVFCDPAASHMRVALRRVGLGARPAVNDVLKGIYAVQQWLAEGRFGISPSCRATVREMTGYSWNEKATEHGEDDPLKENDHAPDAVRYLVYSTQMFPRLQRSTYE